MASGSPRRSPRRRWTPPRRASTRSAPRGPALDKELHVGAATVQVDTGAVKGIYGGQDYLESQINWAVAGGMGGSSLKPFALTAGIKAGFSLKDTFDGNSPFELPDGTGEVENQGDDELRLGGQPAQGHRGLHQHGVRRPHHLHPRRPAEGHGDDERDGDPAREGAAQERLRLPRPHGGSRAVPRHRARLRDGEPDQHGQRLRHHRQRRPVPRAVHHRAGRQQGRRDDLRPLGQRRAGDRPGPGRRHRRRRQLRDAAGGAGRQRHRGPGARPPGRRQDRYRHGLERRCLVVLVHRVHPAAGHVGDVCPRQGHRQARRLAAGLVGRSRRLLRRQLPGQDVDRDHDARHGGGRGGGLPAAGERRRRGTRPRATSRPCRRSRRRRRRRPRRRATPAGRPRRRPRCRRRPSRPRRRRPRCRPRPRPPTDIPTPTPTCDVLGCPTPTPSATATATRAAAAEGADRAALMWVWWNRMRW